MKLLSEHQIPVIDDYDIEDEVVNAKRIFSQTAGILLSQNINPIAWQNQICSESN